jgi:hypothetical protein
LTGGLLNGYSSRGGNDGVGGLTGQVERVWRELIRRLRIAMVFQQFGLLP